jgi:hypothetical protein
VSVAVCSFFGLFSDYHICFVCAAGSELLVCLVTSEAVFRDQAKDIGMFLVSNPAGSI